MEPEFWHERWQQEQIGFHEATVNVHLRRFWPEVLSGLDVPRNENRVFLPLCGKANDLAWLRERGHGVVGVELSPIACHDFFAERALDPKIKEKQTFTRRSHDGIDLLCGDFFDLNPADLGPVALVYDRAALIALPEDMRQAYVEQLIRLTPEARRILLITLAYPEQEAFSGPPFSVPDEEVRMHFAATHSIRQLDHQSIPEDDPLVARGLRAGTESVFLLERR